MFLLESDEEDEFSGNNDEWEQLLKTLTKEEEHVNDKPIGNQKTEVKLELVPRETSFIKLVLPSADEDYKSSSSNKLDIQMNDGNSWVHSPVRSIPDGNETPIQQTAPSSDESRSIFISDSSEEERCSSPIKGLHLITVENEINANTLEHISKSFLWVPTVLL